MIPSLYTVNKLLREHGVSEEKLKEVARAFNDAQWIHEKQERESGEPYISHPLAVAEILVKEMGIYDIDTICAGLLHDAIEDAKIKYDEECIAAAINPTVAKLVSGVTKLKSEDIPDKEKRNAANARKIINGLNEDIRIIYIKLADRLHNMRTLENKKDVNKQREIAQETLDIYVPLAKIVGAYRIKNELEELALKYLDRKKYNRIAKKREKLRRKNQEELQEMADTIKHKLEECGIKGRVVFREQSLYTIHKKIKNGYKIENQDDLHYLKVIVDTIPSCYSTLGIIHCNYKPANGRLKDYIGNEKTTNYQSIHTTVSYKDRFWKFKIRTEEMDKIDAYGFPAYWSIENYDNVASVKYGKTPEETNKEIKEYPPVKKIFEIDKATKDDAKFMKLSRKLVLSEHVYVVNSQGNYIGLPEGSTAADFVWEVYSHYKEYNSTPIIMINGKQAPPNTLLKDGDRVQIIESHRTDEEQDASTGPVKKKIR